MNATRLTLLLVALAALAGGLWYALGVLGEEPPSGPPLPQRAERSLLALEPGEVVRITLDRPRYNLTVRLERAEDRGWSLTEPRRDLAEPVAVISALSALYADDWSEAPAEWSAQDAAALGLAPAELAVEVRDEGGRVQLLRIGAADFAGRWRAAELDGRRIRVGEGLMSPLVRDVESWRDHRIQPLPPPAVAALRWTPESGPALELERADGGWRVLQPYAALLDERQAPFVERMLGARAIQLRSNPLEQEPLQGARLGVLELRGAAGEYRLDLHEDGLRASHRSYAMDFPAEDFALLFRDPESLRSPRLLALDPGKVVSMRIEHGGRAANFRRAAGGWSQEGRGALAEEDARFLDALLEHGARLEGGDWRDLPQEPPAGRVLYSISRTPREGVPTLLWWVAADGSQLAAAAGASRATVTAINFELAVGELFTRLGLR